MLLSETKQRLLDRYQRGAAVSVAAPVTITPRPAGEPAPLSMSQQQLLLRERSVPNLPRLYNECITVRMTGSIDVPCLERSFTEVIRRHEIWRTSYESKQGQPLQIVHPLEAMPLPLTDLRDLPIARREPETHQLIGELLEQAFDLEQGPLLRVRLVRMDDFEYRLYLIAHLSIVDGVSAYQVFPSELVALYTAYSSSEPSPLQELPVQFGDYAYWQRKWMQGAELAKQVNYWRQRLAGQLPVLRWPCNRPRPAELTFRGAIQLFTLSKTVSDAVKSLCRREGVTLFTSLLATFVALLHSYTRQQDVIVGTPSPAGRKQSGVERLLGYFLNPVALRFDLTHDPTFRELLRQTQRSTLEAISNDDAPIELLAEELRPPEDPSRSPFFTVAMSLQPQTPQVGLGWSVTSMDVNSGGAVWDLYIAFIDRQDGIVGRVQYNPDLFDIETILRMLQYYEQLLHGLCADVTQHLSETVTPHDLDKPKRTVAY